MLLREAVCHGRKVGADVFVTLDADDQHVSDGV
jgi:hypothetical protein